MDSGVLGGTQMPDQLGSKCPEEVCESDKQSAKLTFHKPLSNLFVLENIADIGDILIGKVYR